MLSCLSYMEHMRSIRPSPIINTYLLLTLPMDFAQVRTLWLRRTTSAVAAVFTSVSAVKTAVLIAEAVEKGGLLLSPFETRAQESTGGLYSRASFWWLNPLFLLGYKQVLSNDTLLDTDEKLLSKPLHDRFGRQWAKSQSVGGRPTLLTAMSRAMLLPLAASIVPRLCLIFFRFMQPLLIHRVSKFVAQPVTRNSTNQGWGLTAAYGLVYAGMGLSQAIYYHQTYRMITMVRGALVTTIYAKTIELSTTALDESAAVTLMSSDVQNICDALPQLHEVWASVIEIALGIWLLTREIGLALLGPLVVAIVSVFATMAVSKRMGPAQKAWMEAIQSRVDVTSKMLESMKGVKMLGLTPTISSLIRGLRRHEITLSLKSRRLVATCITLANVSSTLAPGVTFIIYVLVNNSRDQTLDVSQAFTTLSLISLMSSPVATLIFAVPPLMGSLGCVERIQSFLFFETRNDHRIVLGSAKRAEYDQRRSPAAVNQDFELQDIAPNAGTSSEVSVPVRLRNATFSWNASDPPVVKDVSFELDLGSLTFIVGPVGCGKTSLLKGLLGEIPSSKGFVYVGSPQTAFVQQTPWIQHRSFRNNVLGTSVFDREWYDIVVHSCALEADITELPQADLTLVGSAGHSLSGGQKHRLALARAVYSRSPILILDDTFSGLDAETEDSIFTRLLGKRGLLRQHGVTVLLVTHAAHRLSYADHIIALAADGTISEEGTFSELMKSGGYVSTLAARHKHEDEDAGEQSRSARDTDDAKSMPETLPEEAVRPLGDIQFYKYYFAAVGWYKTATFFVLIMSFAFFSRFPGEFNSTVVTEYWFTDHG
jgi:ATP-binding cassette, subfamily C (CFTR/MRP), member 1